MAVFPKEFTVFDATDTGLILTSVGELQAMLQQFKQEILVGVQGIMETTGEAVCGCVTGSTEAMSSKLASVESGVVTILGNTAKKVEAATIKANKGSFVL